jgi:hypothetical protein
MKLPQGRLRDRNAVEGPSQIHGHRDAETPGDP